MNISILKKAKNIIQERGRDSVEKYTYEMSKITSNSKYIAADSAVRSNTLAISKALSKSEDTRTLEAENAKLITKLAEVKLSLGVPANCYSCVACEDKGTLANGTNCACLTKVYYELSRQISGIAELPQFTFENNSISNIECVQKESLGMLYNSMQNYSEKFPNTSVKNILLTGQVGVGKSCLLSATANDLILRGFSVQYLTAFSLNNLFLKYHTSDAKIRHQYLDSLLTCDLLIIDDLGTEPILKNITLEYLHCVLDERVRKHTMISTNLSINEILIRYRERIASRLTNKYTKIIQLNGTDLRIKK